MSPTASGPCTGVGTAHECLRIQLIADAQLTPEAPDRMLQRQQRGRVAVRAPHKREEVDRRGAVIRREVQLERQRAAQRSGAVARQPHHVRRAGDIGVELAVGHEGARRPGHVAEFDLNRLPDALRPGRVLLQRAEGPVAVIEHHPDLAGLPQRDHDVLAVHAVEVAERDGHGRTGDRDVVAHEAHLRTRRRNSAQRRSQEHRQRPAAQAPGNVDRASRT